MRPTRPARRNTPLVEPLERRTLLSGVTIITHGAEFLSTDRPSWIDTMAVAIRNLTGPSTAIYAIRVVPDGSNVKIAGMARLAGPAPGSSASTNDETVLLLDWAAASTVNLLGLSASYSVSTIASAVMPYLTNAIPSIGLNAPLVEGSIQLIGHSRGAPLVTELAKDLGQKGIWVDQVTTLDSAPVPPDPGSSLKSNVIFADNYYQHSGDGIFVPNGSSISGAFNVGALSLGGAYGTLDGKTHGDVHLFYFGTINTASNASDGSAKVVDSWYPNNGVTKQTTGFYYSRLGGGTRPLSGVGTAFGGSGSRGSITHSGAQWPNIGTIVLSSNRVGEDGAFGANFRYNSFGTGATISWFIDVDTNPYNENSISISNDLNVSGTGDAPVIALTNFQANASAGIYYLEGRISNANGTRYDYSTPFILGNLPPTGAIATVKPNTILGWAIDPDSADTSINIRADADGTPFYTGPANIDLPVLLSAFSTTTHGFSVDVSSLPAGLHTINIYALDATNASPVLIGTRVEYVNSLPVGHFDAFDGSTITGWALDPNTGASPSQIQIRIDNLPPIYATADASRPDLPGNASAHGFSVALPQLTAGVHSVTVSAIDSTTSALQLLGTRFAVVRAPSNNPLPRGVVNSLSTTLITGWAFDASTPGTAAQVRIDVDGVSGTLFTTNVSRPDVHLGFAGVTLGFSAPLSLTPGEHKIDVYVLDTTSNTPVLIFSRIIGSAPPIGAIEIANNSTTSGYAWSPALGASPATIRIDIDNYVGNTFVTSIVRNLPAPHAAVHGTFGYSIQTPPLPKGSHTLALFYIDPFTLVVTKLATRTLVTT